jgi:glycopeptide antibiotics resistance protein
VVVALLYVTTVPFGLEVPANFARKWQRTEILPFYLRKGEIYHPSDLLGNFLLFLPFGFALQGWRRERRGPRNASLWPTIAGGMVMSFAIEATQFFLKDRFTSINDWVLNVAGTAAGAALAQGYYTTALDRWLRTNRRLLQRPGVLVLLLLLAAYALWMLLPFNFTLSTSNLQRKWLQWKFSAAYLAALPHESLTLDRREYWPLVVCENVLFGLLLGGQFVLCCRWYRPENLRFFRGGIALLGFALILITFSQFVVIGSNPDVLPLMAAALGLTIGLIIMRKGAAGTEQLPVWSMRASPTAPLLFTPLILLFLLLLGRPDLPDLRVAQTQTLQNNASGDAMAVLFAHLRDSMRPSFLHLGGSAYFRLFLKLLLITTPVAFALAQIKPRRFNIARGLEYLAVILLAAAAGLLAQVLRFLLWKGGISLLAVLALMMGGTIGFWVANWWEKFTLELRQDPASIPTSPEQGDGNPQSGA